MSFYNQDEFLSTKNNVVFFHFIIELLVHPLLFRLYVGNIFLCGLPLNRFLKKVLNSQKPIVRSRLNSCIKLTYTTELVGEVMSIILTGWIVTYIIDGQFKSTDLKTEYVSLGQGTCTCQLRRVQFTEVEFTHCTPLFLDHSLFLVLILIQNFFSNLFDVRKII